MWAFINHFRAILITRFYPLVLGLCLFTVLYLISPPLSQTVDDSQQPLIFLMQIGMCVDIWNAKCLVVLVLQFNVTSNIKTVLVLKKNSLLKKIFFSIFVYCSCQVFVCQWLDGRTQNEITCKESSVHVPSICWHCLRFWARPNFSLIMMHLFFFLF